MKIVYNNIIPFKGYKAINIFGILFARKGCKIDEGVITHESIHSAQIKELRFILFYIWYLIEWIMKLFVYGSDAYYNISFEREAYCNMYNKEYIKNRKHYTFLRYL